MEYAGATIPGLAPDETGYVTSGQYAAVRLTRSNGAAANMFGFTACAFAVEADGTPTLTAAMGSIEGVHTVSCFKTDLLVNGVLSNDKVAELKNQAIQGALTEMLAIVAEEAAYNQLNV